MNSRVIVAAIIRKGNKYLLGHKPNNKGPYPNTWHLLGGGVNLADEKLEEAVRREIKEEAGVEVDIKQRISFDEDYEPDKHGEMTHYIFLVYDTVYTSGSMKAMDDIEELKWFDKSELKHVPLTRPSVKLFKELRLI